MKLALIVEKDDLVLQEGGALATKRWEITPRLIISVRSGYEDGFYGGPSSPPRLIVHGDNFSYGDFRSQFDLASFEAALAEAKIEVQRMEEFIAAKFLELKNA